MYECVYKEPQRLARASGMYPILESRMKVTFHVRFGEGGGETRRLQGPKVRSAPTLRHIPGAVNLPYEGNIGEDGRFLSREALRERFEDSLKGVAPERTTFYCGSGVSAAQNLLALAHAGLTGGRLYAGSWSEWILDPSRPRATIAED